MKWTLESFDETKKNPLHVRSMDEKKVGKEIKTQDRNEETQEDGKKLRENISFAEGTEKSSPERIAIVRCETVSEVCPGVACFKAFNKKKLHFKEYESDTEIIGFFTCGGCPGRRVSRLVKSLIKHGLTTVHLSSCMMLDSGYPPCPHIEEIRKSIESKGLKVVQGTHH